MGQLRIIAGRLKGRKIDVPAASAVRPTSDRAREALFNIFADSIAGARVLDAYAGSGALGFEALSRGAASLVSIEADRAVVETIRNTAQRLGVAGLCSVLHGDVVRVLSRPGAPGPFDLILADPPYSGEDCATFLSVAAGNLDVAGRIVLERESPEGAPSSPAVDLRRSARYGRCSFHFYARTANPRRTGA